MNVGVPAHAGGEDVILNDNIRVVSAFGGTCVLGMVDHSDSAGGAYEAFGGIGDKLMSRIVYDGMEHER